MPCFASTAIAMSAALMLTLGSIGATVPPLQAPASALAPTNLITPTLA